MRPLGIFLLLAAAASAQVGVDGITASISRTVSLAPDEASVSALVATDLGVTPQQAADALQAAGIPAPSLVAVTAQSVDYG